VKVDHAYQCYYKDTLKKKTKIHIIIIN